MKTQTTSHAKNVRNDAAFCEKCTCGQSCSCNWDHHCAPVANGELADELVPEYVFSMTATQLLVDVANGKINLAALARNELANRGLNQKGVWVGPARAKEIAKCYPVRDGQGRIRLVSIPENDE